MGDPGGIGPEIAVRAVVDEAVRKAADPVVLGDPGFLRSVVRRVLGPVPVRKAGPDRRPEPGEIGVIGVGRVGAGFGPGKATAEGGRIAGLALGKAVGMASSGEAAGLVTAPVSKESLALAGYGMVGHTELIARQTGSRSYAMMIVAGKLRVIFATQHVALGQVAGKIDRKRLVEKLMVADRYLRLYMGIRRPRIAVACLNPHCGESGVLGREEEAEIRPAIDDALEAGARASGPYPADSVFRRAFARDYDAILAMYHDQGMIPLKIQGHDRVVNITLGVPCVRTSPGHGTAFDLAGKGKASPRSMVRAILECARIATRLEHAG
jgi:4-hydroxythreonine-4-phosphate dehydrogenase